MGIIDINDEKIGKIVLSLHKKMNKLVKGVKGELEERLANENKVVREMCVCGSSDINVILNSLHSNGSSLSFDDAMELLRRARISAVYHREDILNWANEMTWLFEQAIAGDEEKFKEMDKKRKMCAFDRDAKKHETQERIWMFCIYIKHPELNVYDDMDNLMKMTNTIARYASFDMVDYIAAQYGFTVDKPASKNKFRVNVKSENVSGYNKESGEYENLLDSSKEPKGSGAEKLGSLETDVTEHKEKCCSKQKSDDAVIDGLKNKIDSLNMALERQADMMSDMQDEFDRQLEDSKSTELTEFFSKLNSEKYGCILDELLSLRAGVGNVKKSGYELPVEINGIIIVFKKMLQFIKDSHINPMMKVGDVQEVFASDIEFCEYIGEPFKTADDIKEVVVASPGWVYKDKNIQISRPKLIEKSLYDSGIMGIAGLPADVAKGE